MLCVPTLPVLAFDGLRIGFPVVQAALSGYSDWAMRVVARRAGASYAVGEVVLDQALLQRGKHSRRSLFVTPDEQPAGAQLMGSRPEQFGPAARRLAEAGFSVVDINFGCPVKKVLGRGRGGFHLGQPEVALEIVSRVRDSLPARIPVTVKLRAGIDESAESRERFFAVLDGAFERGAAAATVHGRTVRQRYDGPANWEFLRRVKQHAGPRRTIIGSGDLWSAADCLRMIEQTGVDGASVARGAIGNPWIFREARALFAGRPLPDPPSMPEQRDVIALHYRLAERIYGPEQCCRLLRKHGIAYAARHPRAAEVRAAFIAVRRPDEWRAVLERWYH